MNKKDKEEFDNVKIQIERLKSFFKVDSVDKVFKKLDIKLSTYTNYYNRGRLPKKLINKLNIEYQLNPEWLYYGKGSMLITPSHSKLCTTEKREDPYKSSSCMIICDAIHRREPKEREMLVAKLLEFINSLNLPLV